jgi:hypothetical protein
LGYGLWVCCFCCRIKNLRTREAFVMLFELCRLLVALDQLRSS